MKTVSMLWNTRRVVYEQGKNWLHENSVLGNTERLALSKGRLRLQGQFNSRKTASGLVITGSKGRLRLQGQFNSRKTVSVLVNTGSSLGDTVGQATQSPATVRLDSQFSSMRPVHRLGNDMCHKWMPPPERENKEEIKKIKVLFLTLLSIHLWKGRKLLAGYCLLYTSDAADES